MYPQSMFLSKNIKIVKNFQLKFPIFTAVKYCCILHGNVCVMMYLTLNVRRFISKDSIKFQIYHRFSEIFI